MLGGWFYRRITSAVKTHLTHSIWLFCGRKTRPHPKPCRVRVDLNSLGWRMRVVVMTSHTWRWQKAQTLSVESFMWKLHPSVWHMYGLLPPSCCFIHVPISDLIMFRLRDVTGPVAAYLNSHILITMFLTGRYNFHVHKGWNVSPSWNLTNWRFSLASNQSPLLRK